MINAHDNYVPIVNSDILRSIIIELIIHVYCEQKMSVKLTDIFKGLKVPKIVFH